ncbi:unnamed protein product, partial [Heterotrigona itama]
KKYTEDNIMERVVSNTFCLNGKSKGENTCASVSYISTMFGDMLSLKDKSKLPNQMNKYFERLSIESCLEHNQENNKHLAGEIKNIIKTLYIPLAVVKPCSLNTLLYIGTPLFLNCTNFYDNESRYTLLGYIDDIFGSVGEPMYSVSIKLNPTIDILNINAK